MPVIIAYGIPSQTKLHDLEKFCNALIQRTAAVEELELTEKEVSCFFPRDLMDTGLGEEIIIFVEGLFETPQRTEEVRNRLADRLAECGKKFFPEADVCECFIKPFNPKLGFAGVKRRN